MTFITNNIWTFWTYIGMSSVCWERFQYLGSISIIQMWLDVIYAKLNVKQCWPAVTSWALVRDGLGLCTESLHDVWLSCFWCHVILVVIDTLRIWLYWLVAPPSFLGTIPQARVLLMSLICNCRQGHCYVINHLIELNSRIIFKFYTCHCNIEIILIYTCIYKLSCGYIHKHVCNS